MDTYQSNFNVNYNDIRVFEHFDFSQNTVVWFAASKTVIMSHYFYFYVCLIAGKKFFPVTFFGSILWIAAFSYLMVWWATITGEAFTIPPEVRLLLH